MTEDFLQSVLQIQFLVPPLLGALIGYLTNKVAIRMLFRPLKEWRVFGIRLPMTPGVIPSKRHQLAENIGEMVGEHLLTSNEIGNALQKNTFQNHLGSLITKKAHNLVSLELPSIPQLIPLKYKSYYDIGLKTVSYKIKSGLNDFIHKEQFEKLLHEAVSAGMDDLLLRDVDSLFSKRNRDRLYEKINPIVEKMFEGSTMESWVEDFVYARLNTIKHKSESLNDILPESLVNLILRNIETKTPDLLEKLSHILKEPEIQHKIIEGVKKGVDGFVVSMGPMGGMIQNFLNIDTIEKIVLDYFANNEKDIEKWLADKDVQDRVAQSLLERANHYLKVPITDFFSHEDSINPEILGKSISRHIVNILREKNVSNMISSIIIEHSEVYIDGGNLEINNLIGDLTGDFDGSKIKKISVSKVLNIARSDRTKSIIDKLVDRLLHNFMEKSIGQLSNIVPRGVIEGVCASSQKLFSAMLVTEIPGLVKTLNIRKIVTDKIDTLDLLKLEELLLSIMQEQFKYINLFGALLGFLIGCLNILILLMIQ